MSLRGKAACLRAVLAGDLVLFGPDEPAVADDVLAADEQPVDAMRCREHEPGHAILGAAQLEAVGAPDREIGALARPRSSRCRPARARPRRLASPSRSASRHVIAAGPPRPRATSSACLTSKKRSERSFDAEPSTPSPTRTPASTSSRTGATPAPSRRLEVGQCATPTPAPANVCTSAGERWTQCAHQTSDAVQPELGEVLDRCAAVELPAVRVFLHGLREMRVELQAEPPRQRRRVGHQLLRHRERRARRDGDLHHRARPGLVQPAGQLLRRRQHRIRLLHHRVRRQPAMPTRRDPSTRARRRCARRAPAPPAPPPPRARSSRAERRSGDRRRSCTRTTQAPPAPSAPPRTPPRRRAAPTRDRARAAT